MIRIPNTDPGARVDTSKPERFHFDENDPAVKRLLAAGIPRERLVAADIEPDDES